MKSVIIGAMILGVLLAFMWQRRNEKRDWNDGVCAISGKPWRLFDYDSQGGRGYTDGEHYCWISYAVDTTSKTPQK